jgi:IstB-like ATP binding protein
VPPGALPLALERTRHAGSRTPVSAVRPRGPRPSRSPACAGSAHPVALHWGHPCTTVGRERLLDTRQYVAASAGTGKTHLALGLGLAACQKGLAVGFITAAALVHELIEARDEKRLLRLQRQLAACQLLIIDELGYVPLSPTGAELLFEVFSQRYERGSVIVTSNLPFDEWTSVFGSERLTGALLDRLTHHVHILEMNGESYRLRQSKHRRRSPRSDASQPQAG